MYNRMIALQPDNPGGYAQRGLLYRLQKKYSQALVDYEKALSLNPQLKDVAAEVVAVHMINKHPDQALAFCRTLLERDPRDAFADNLMGRIYLSTQKLELAKKSFETAIGKNPELLSSYVRAGVIRKQ
ncbi:MAG: hypothetical protein BZ151_13490 [Desulfobacca sp. 4484_104]|nr:MAG: hypothetical protein BZ151_13490 [Desulfobacca sp. 4484_104]